MSEQVDLSVVERRILANQARILAVLDPQERERHEDLARVYESGFQLEYPNAICIYDEVSESVCREALDILEMFQFLQKSYDNLTDKNGIEAHEVTFGGFDANNEGQYLDYACYYCQSKRKFGFLRFGAGEIQDQFDQGRIIDLNSHMPYLDGYRRMLAPWRDFHEANTGRLGHMTKDELRAILDGAIHPICR